MASKSRVSGSTTRAASGQGAAFKKDVQQPAPGDDAPEFDPTRPAAFDLGAFISGAKEHTNTRTIPVTSRPVEAAELERLTADRDKLARVTDEDAQQAEGGSPRRLSAISDRRQKLLDIEARIAELEEELDGTWLLVKVRGLKPTEQDAIRKKRVEVGVPLFCAMFEQVGLVRDPAGGEWGTLTADGWAELVEAIGSAQYVTLDQAVDALTYQAVTPDFYERYSASRATRSTSSS